MRVLFDGIKIWNLACMTDGKWPSLFSLHLKMLLFLVQQQHLLLLLLLLLMVC